MTRRRLLIVFAIALLVLAALPAALVYYLAYTPDGLQFIARHIPKRIGRIQMEIVAPRGILARGVELERFELEHPRVHIRIEAIKGRLAIIPLLWQTIDARDASVGKLLIEVRRRTEPPDNNPLRFLPVPLVIRAEGVRVAQGTLIATNGKRLEATQLQTSGVVRQYSLKFFDGALSYEAMRITGNATLTAADPLKLAADARISIAWPQQPVWTIDASGQGDLDALDLNLRFATPFRADFVGQARDLTGNWNWLGNARIHDFDLRVWGGGGALGRITGQLAVRGDARGFSARGPLTPAGLKAGAFETLFEGNYADRTVSASRIELHHASGAFARGAGDIRVVSNGPQLDLRGAWRDFRWPLRGHDVAVRSSAGEYELNGVWPYHWRAQGMLFIPALAESLQPPASGNEGLPFIAEGKLAKDRVFLDAVSAKAFEGRVELAGEVQWSPLERWSLSGQASGINPARLRADLPGKLNFGFNVEGAGFKPDGDFELAVQGLTGQLRGVKAAGSGRLARRQAAGAGKPNTLWEFDDVRLSLGGTLLTANGSLTRELDLRFTLDSSDLSLLAPDSRGRLHAQGNLHGTLEEPVISAEIHGGDIQHAGAALASLDAKIDFDALNRRPSHIELRARKLAYAQRRLDTLDFNLNGTAAAHTAVLKAQTGTLAVELAADGLYAHGAWTGQLRGLNLDDRDVLNLSLDAPIALILSAAHLKAERLCLHGTPGQLCAAADWTPQAWNASFEAHDLPLGSLTTGLTPGVEYRGSLAVNARVFGGGATPVQGELDAGLVDARILHRLASGKLQSILLGSGKVTVRATPEAIETSVGLSAGIGTISGRAALLRKAQRWQDFPLSGSLQIETAELGFATLYAPQIDRAAGKLITSLNLSGTAGTPFVDGRLTLSDAEIDLYQINLALRDMQVAADLKSNSLDFKGSARIGAGTVQTSGKLLWRESLPYGELHLQGENLRAVDVPEAKIDASPDLDFKLTGTRIEVSGKVAVPYAKIVPRDLRNAVRASSDEVLIGATAPPPGKRFEVLSTVTLALGDKVSIDTLGLTARLKGNLTVRSGYDPITHGTGELSVEEGKYTAYGRRLDIQRGRLIFSGGPVEDPGLDIRAIKQFPDVIAGVNVRGTLLAPRTSFFSEPSLPQSQIVSLILAGGSLGSVQAQSQAQNKQSGNELLAQGGAILAQQLGSRVGIEDVSLEQDLTNETSLVLGKYLSPRLYVSYGISLAEAINTLKLRYSLNDRWTVKSEVGQARGADLVYTIEK